MRIWLRLVSWFNRKAKNLSIRLVKWTGKSKEFVHPKHFIETDDHYWFVSFLDRADTVLDLGCGCGAHSIKAAHAAAFVKGIDHSPRNLEIAKRLAAQNHLNKVEFVEGSLEEPIQEPADSYSAILALDILEHLLKRDEFLNETHRLLKRDSRLFLSVPNSETSWKKKLKKHNLFFYSDFDHKHEYTEPEIKDILNKHRFEIIFFEPTVYDTPWVGMIDLVGGISLPFYKRLSEWKRKMGLEQPSEATGFRIVARKK